MKNYSKAAQLMLIFLLMFHNVNANLWNIDSLPIQAILKNNFAIGDISPESLNANYLKTGLNRRMLYAKESQAIEENDYDEKLFSTLDEELIRLEIQGNDSLSLYSMFYSGMKLLAEKKYIEVNNILNQLQKLVQSSNEVKVITVCYYKLKHTYENAIGNYKNAFEDSKKYKVALVQYWELRNKLNINNPKYSYNLTTALATQIERQRIVIWILTLLSVLISALAVVVYRISVLRRQNEFKRDIAESELKSSRSKLNLHFVQNTFDLIAQQIRLNNPEQAVSKLRHVSFYLREVLNKSDLMFLNIEQELEYTREYLNVQKLIYPDLFTYTIKVPDNVDTIGIKVPNMLLQPILENCFKHGFNTMASGGNIEIILNEDVEKLNIQIKDNGRGIQGDAYRLKNTSVGIDLTKKRLMMMLGNKKVIGEIIKMYNRTDGITGTEVLITIPL